MCIRNVNEAQEPIVETIISSLKVNVFENITGNSLNNLNPIEIDITVQEKN